MRKPVLSLDLLSGLRILHCHELWCRSKTKLGSGIAVAVVQAGSYISNSTPNLGTSICHVGVALERQKKKITEYCVLGTVL